MEYQRNARILETVIEELETGKGGNKTSRIKSAEKTKSAKGGKIKTKNNQKKSKQSKSVNEKGTEETKKIVVAVPLTEPNNSNINHVTAFKNKEELSKSHVVKDDNENIGESSNQADKINVEVSTINQNSASDVKADGVQNMTEIENRLFTTVFSLKHKENDSTKKDFIVTPNGNVQNSMHSPDNTHNKENELTKEASTISEEFIRSNSDKSILTTRSEPLGDNKSKPTPKRRRPMSTSALTKKELEAYLPRKSFFSSHDKVLREAGFQVDDAMKKKKRPNWRLILRMHTEDELNPDWGTEEEKEVVKEPQVKEESDDDGEESVHLTDAVETLMSQEKDGQTTKRRFRQAFKKFGTEEKCDYKPLLEYLKYINEHPEEYMTMARYSSKNLDYKHPSVMVRMARVFRRAHHGTARNNIFTHALAGLKPKFTDQQSQQRHGRGELAKKDQTDTQQEQSNVSLEEAKTEIEKLKVKTEKWMGGLTTMQILKAKELALKDMGEEDITVTKWWLAFKTCNYLRIPPTVLEQAQ